MKIILCVCFYVLWLTEIQGRKELGQVVIRFFLRNGIPAEVMLIDSQITALVEVGTDAFAGFCGEIREEAADEGEGNAVADFPAGFRP